MWHVEREWIEPIVAATRLQALPGLSFLDSAMGHETLGRYSYIAADPFGVFHVENGYPFWNGIALPGAPLAALRAQLALFPLVADPALPSFQGGAIGTLDYEFGWALDQGPRQAHAPTGRTVQLDFYDTVLAFDHGARRCWIIGTGWPSTTPASRRQKAETRIAEVERLLAHEPLARSDAPLDLVWWPDVARAAYDAAIERVKAYILAGDIYQANIAQGFSAPIPEGADALSLYARLRVANPAPFAAFLRRGDASILCTSPERLLRTRGRHVETRPIKGTAARALDTEVDAALARALLASAKDRAENVMIVDLLRNDLSRVCTPSSVAVPVLCGLESYAGLHHLVSVVTGDLSHDHDALDLIGAMFPGGSITGAPKLRAMEIIAEIEDRPRGIYCGAIGAIGFDGNVDFNIAIRTMVVEGATARFQSGGGITILSDPAIEYAETLTKAERIFAAFASADAPA